MPKTRGRVFDTPDGGATSPATKGIAQQIQIAVAHQLLTVMHEPDRSIAKVVGFPGACGDALCSKQGFGNGAIGCTVLACIKRAQALDQTSATLNRQLTKVRARRATREGTPQAPRGMRAQLEEIIERKLRGLARANTRPSSEPCTVVDVLAPQKHVPAIGCLANYNVGEIAQSDKAKRIGVLSRGMNKGDNGRYNR